MKTEQLYKFVPIEEAKDICDEQEYFIRNYEEDEFSKIGKDIKRVVSTYPDALTHILLPFHPSPKEISEEEARAERDRIYPLADEDDYPENPDCNRIANACRGAFMNGYLFASLPSSGSKTEAVELLQECKLQLEYLNKKFPETGTTNSVLSRVDGFLQKHDD